MLLVHAAAKCSFPPYTRHCWKSKRKEKSSLRESWGRGHPRTHSTTPSPMAPPNVTPQPEPPATHSPNWRAKHKQLQFTPVFLSEASNGFNCNFHFFFSPPGRRRWHDLFHGKFQFLFPIWKRNRIISLRSKKSFKRLLAPHGRPRSPPSPRKPLAPGEQHSMARLWAGVDWMPSQT